MTLTTALASNAVVTSNNMRVEGSDHGETNNRKRKETCKVGPNPIYGIRCHRLCQSNTTALASLGRISSWTIDIGANVGITHDRIGRRVFSDERNGLFGIAKTRFVSCPMPYKYNTGHGDCLNPV